MLTLKELSSEPYSSLICYPRFSKAEFRKRINQLEHLGITALEFSGEKNIFNIPVLGKGCVGIVIIAYTDNQKNALKIRRVDADRRSMRHEVEMLRKANSLSIGPALRKASRDFLVMQFVEGSLLFSWIAGTRAKSRLRRVLRSVMEQCFLLDRAGLDHGELSRAPKHIIINSTGKPFLVDFESASSGRRPANVTSICQFLFLHGETARRIRLRLRNVDDETVLSSLRKYKRDPNRENFEVILKACGL